MKTTKRFASIAVMSVMVVMGISSTVWADQQTRLRAGENKRINGFEAELRGDYRENHTPIRLNAELERINLPVGTKVAFCLVQNGVKTRIGVGRVHKEGTVSVAEVELSANDGDSVPNVSVGDILQVRQHTAEPFIANPGCGANLLMAAPFEK